MLRKLLCFIIVYCKEFPGDILGDCGCQSQRFCFLCVYHLLLAVSVSFIYLSCFIKFSGEDVTVGKNGDMYRDVKQICIHCKIWLYKVEFNQKMLQ